MSKKNKRDNASYIQSAIKLSDYVPALKKYKRRKRLKPSEKGVVARWERRLKYVLPKLRPLTATQAKQLKDELFRPRLPIKSGIHEGEYRSYGGVRAIVLENTETKAEIHHIKKDLFITSNGRLWVYWKLNRYSELDMARAAKSAFTEVRQSFPLEKIAELAERAFEKLTTKEVYLWTINGRVGEGYKDLKQFLKWLSDNWGGYQEPETWVRGIAIRL